MTQVRIRQAGELDSRYLADVPFDQLDAVIPTIQGWSIEGEEPELTGQFAYGSDGQSVYFEIVVGDYELG